MQGKLRQRYAVHKEVSRRGYFKGRIELAELGRLSDLLVSSENPIEVNFEFMPSEYSIPQVAGQVSARLQMQCQRCLQPMTEDFQLDFRLLVDADDELVHETSLDTIYSEAGYVDVFELIEDEIILALPLVAMHENEACNIHWQIAEQAQQSVEKENPFSVLKELKLDH